MGVYYNNHISLLLATFWLGFQDSKFLLNPSCRFNSQRQTIITNYIKFRQMKSFMQKREQRETQRRRQERRQLVADKRKHLIPHHPTKPQLQNSLLHQQQLLLSCKDWQTTQSCLSSLNQLISWYRLPPSPRLLSHLLTLLSNSPHPLQTTQLLANITSLQNLNEQLLIQLLSYGQVFIDLVSKSKDLEVIESVVLVVGNLATEGEGIKKQVMGSVFFKRINEVLRGNYRNMGFVSTVLWVYKNVMLRDRRRTGAKLQDLGFVGRPLEIIVFLLKAWQEMTRTQQYMSQEMIQQLQKNKEMCYQLLVVVVAFSNANDYAELWKYGLEECLGLALNSLAMLDLSIMGAVLNFLSQMASFGFPLPQQLPSLLPSLPITSLPKSSLLSLVQLTSILKPAPPYLLPHLPSLWQECCSNPTFRSLHSKYILSLITTPLVHTICKEPTLLNIITKYIPTLLDDDNVDTVRNGLMVVMVLTDEMGDSAKEMVQETGIAGRLVGLQMHQNKQVYQTVIDLIQLLEIDQDNQ